MKQHRMGADKPFSADELISPNQAAMLLGVTGEAVKRWIYLKRLPAIKLANGYWKVRVSDFECFLRARMKGPAPACVLLSSDEERASVSNMLEDIGFRVVPMENTGRTLRDMSAIRPRLMLANLDSSTAWFSIGKVRRCSAAFNLPIIGYKSSPLSDNELGDALEMGLKAFLRSPFLSSELSREVRQAAPIISG